MLMHDINIFMVRGTKLDDSFPVPQFNIESFSEPFTLDQNKRWRHHFINSQLHYCSKIKYFLFPNDMEAFFIEINLEGKILKS